MNNLYCILLLLCMCGCGNRCGCGANDAGALDAAAYGGCGGNGCGCGSNTLRDGINAIAAICLVDQICNGCGCGANNGCCRG